MIKEIVIEESSWFKIRDLTAKRKTKYEDTSDLIQDLLEKHKAGEIDFNPYELDSKRNQRKVRLEGEALDWYNTIRKGDKAYIVNGLLRMWLKENEFLNN